MLFRPTEKLDPCIYYGSSCSAAIHNYIGKPCTTPSAWELEYNVRIPVAKNFSHPLNLEEAIAMAPHRVDGLIESDTIASTKHHKPNSILRVHGTDIVDGSGQRIVLKGVRLRSQPEV
jgi:hypothetical protein